MHSQIITPPASLPYSQRKTYSPASRAGRWSPARSAPRHGSPRARTACPAAAVSCPSSGRMVTPLQGDRLEEGRTGDAMPGSLRQGFEASRGAEPARGRYSAPGCAASSLASVALPFLRRSPSSPRLGLHGALLRRAALGASYGEALVCTGGRFAHPLRRFALRLTVPTASRMTSYPFEEDALPVPMRVV